MRKRIFRPSVRKETRLPALKKYSGPPNHTAASLLLSTCLLLQQQPAVFAQSAQPERINLDLQSTDRNLSAAHLTENGSVSITTGQTSRQIDSKSLVTPAERLAVYQMVSTGHQSIILGVDGNAIGGTLNIGARFDQFVSGLVVPANVTVIKDIAASSTLNLVGNLVNAGTFIATSSISTPGIAQISANNIINQTGALIATSSALNNVSLSLLAHDSIINNGTIFSASNLVMAAANSITNSGTISAQANIAMQALNISNITTGTNLASVLSSASLNVNTNTLVNSAVMQAARINVSNVSGASLAVDNALGQILASDRLTFTAQNLAGLSTKPTLSVLGGDLRAKDSIDFTSSGGYVLVAADRLDGPVNLNAGDAHLGTYNGDLVIASSILTGDPIYFAGGNLDLTSIFPASGVLTTSGADFVALAGGSINLNGSLGKYSIDTSNSSGVGGAITLAAGVTFNVTGGTSPVTCTNCSGLYAITGKSTTGGDVVGQTVSLNTNGGAVTLRGENGNVASGNVLIGAITTSGSNGIGQSGRDGNPGMNGGAITINSGGVVDTGALIVSGGNGANGLAAPGNAITNGGFGGAGGRAGAITITAEDNVGTASIIATGGAGGDGGGGASNTTALGSPGGFGGFGGAGGDTGALNVVSTQGNINLGTVAMKGGVGGSGASGGKAHGPGLVHGGVGGAGGVGGNGGVVGNVLLTAGVGIDFNSLTLLGGKAGSGGDGGTGGSSTVSDAGRGGAGGVGGQGGSINAVSLAAGDGHTVRLNTLGLQGGNGGAGGKGGVGGDTGTNNGGFGGDGGAGGTGGGFALVQINRGNADIKDVAMLSGSGGAGGAAGDAGGGTAGGVGGTGAQGGGGGNIGNLRFGVNNTQIITIASFGIYTGDGGKGGAGGQGGDGLDGRSGGPSGAGGDGGSFVDLSFTGASLNLPNVIVSAGDGGAGGDGKRGGYTSVVAFNAGDGGDGGHGGKGGSVVAVNLNATNGITLGGLRVSGGAGSQGGTGGAGGNNVMLPIPGALAAGKGGKGGDGGAGGGIRDITVNAGSSDITLTSDIVFSSGVGAQGGLGGQGGFALLTVGQTGPSKANGGSGGDAGAGGAGGDVGTTHISVTGRSVFLQQFAVIAGAAGNGGNGGWTGFPGNGDATSGKGGDGGAGGSIVSSVNISATQTLQMSSFSAVAGKGGDGGIPGDFNEQVIPDIPGYAGGSNGGTGGVGGAGGKIGSITVSGAQQLKIDSGVYITAGKGGTGSAGRNGENFYIPTLVSVILSHGGDGGAGERGGTGGSIDGVSLTSSGAISTGYVLVQAGDGGNGGGGASGGDSISIRPGAGGGGGAGGDGGSITNGTTISAGTTLKITGTDGVKVSGGDAGNGGLGGNTGTFVTPFQFSGSFSPGPGGKGGQGGNAGSLTISSVADTTITGSITSQGGKGGIAGGGGTSQPGPGNTQAGAGGIGGNGGLSGKISISSAAFSAAQIKSLGGSAGAGGHGGSSKPTAISSGNAGDGGNGGKGGAGGDISVNSTGLFSISSLISSGGDAGRGGDGGTGGAALSGASGGKGGDGQTAGNSGTVSVTASAIKISADVSSIGGAGGFAGAGGNGGGAFFGAHAGAGGFGGKGGDSGQLTLKSTAGSIEISGLLNATAGNAGFGGRGGAPGDGVVGSSGANGGLGGIGGSTGAILIDANTSALLKNVQVQAGQGGNGGAGGQGGDGLIGVQGGNGANGGIGGSTGTVQLKGGTTVSAQFISIAAGDGGFGREAGRGGAGAGAGRGGSGGHGANGGSTGDITITSVAGALTLTGSLQISSGNGGFGGDGKSGGGAIVSANAGPGGNGGNAGSIGNFSISGGDTVSLTDITFTGGFGGRGGDGGTGVGGAFAASGANGGSGGNGGGSGNISITATGSLKAGVFQMLGGSGATGGSGGNGGNGLSSGDAGAGGNAGSGGSLGSLTLTSGGMTNLSAINVAGGLGANGASGGTAGNAGSNGGIGGNSGNGGNGGSTGNVSIITIGSLQSSQAITNTAGKGGDGANGGSSGFSVFSRGGAGGSGGQGGNGGQSGFIKLESKKDLVAVGGPVKTAGGAGGRGGNGNSGSYGTLGGGGSSGGAGGTGGAGGVGRSAGDISVTAATSISVNGGPIETVGGAGGSGGQGGAGGPGGTKGGAAGPGGAGGLAEGSGSVTVTAGTSLTVIAGIKSIASDGGNGGVSLQGGYTVVGDGVDGALGGEGGRGGYSGNLYVSAGGNIEVGTLSSLGGRGGDTGGSSAGSNGTIQGGVGATGQAGGSGGWSGSVSAIAGGTLHVAGVTQSRAGNGGNGGFGGGGGSAGFNGRNGADGGRGGNAGSAAPVTVYAGDQLQFDSLVQSIGGRGGDGGSGGNGGSAISSGDGGNGGNGGDGFLPGNGGLRGFHGGRADDGHDGAPGKGNLGGSAVNLEANTVTVSGAIIGGSITAVTNSGTGTLYTIKPIAINKTLTWVQKFGLNVLTLYQTRSAYLVTSNSDLDLSNFSGGIKVTGTSTILPQTSLINYHTDGVDLIAVAAGNIHASSAAPGASISGSGSVTTGGNIILAAGQDTSVAVTQDFVLLGQANSKTGGNVYLRPPQGATLDLVTNNGGLILLDAQGNASGGGVVTANNLTTTTSPQLGMVAIDAAAGTTLGGSLVAGYALLNSHSGNLGTSGTPVLLNTPYVTAVAPNGGIFLNNSAASSTLLNSQSGASFNYINTTNNAVLTIGGGAAFNSGQGVLSGGTATFTSDQINFGAPVKATTSVTIRPLNDVPIGIGTGAPGTFQVTDFDLKQITTDTLFVGASNLTGKTTIGNYQAPVKGAGNYNVVTNNTGPFATISDAYFLVAGLTVNSPTASIASGTTLSAFKNDITFQTQATNLAVTLAPNSQLSAQSGAVKFNTNGSGSITVTGPGDLNSKTATFDAAGNDITVATGTLRGIVTANGKNISISSDGLGLQTAAVTATGGSLTLNAADGVLTIAGPASATGAVNINGTFVVVNNIVKSTAAGITISTMPGAGSAHGTTKLNGDVTAAGNILLSGVGSIIRMNGTLIAPQVTLQNTFGDIGAGLPGDAGNVVVKSPILIVNAAGSAAILSENALTLQSAAAGNGKTFQILTKGTLTVATGIASGSGRLDTIHIHTTGGGDIISTAQALNATTVELASDGGTLGTQANPLLTNTSNLSANSAGSGTVYISNTGAVSLLDSGTGSNGSLTVINTGAITSTADLRSGTIFIQGDSDVSLKNASALKGDLTVIAGQGSAAGTKLSVGDNGILLANEGNLTLQNADPTGTITLGTNASLIGFSTGASDGVVKIFVGAAPVPATTATPANITELVLGGIILYGANSISANAPTNLLTSINGLIQFDAGAAAQNITLNGGVKILSLGKQTPNVPISSLDLTSAPNVAFIQTLQNSGLVGGKLTYVNGRLTGNAIVDSSNLFHNVSTGLIQLSAENIPTGVSVIFKNFGASPQDAINYDLSASSTTKQIVVEGTHAFKGASSVGVMNISSTQAGPVLIVQSTGALTSDGSLTISGNGDFRLNGVVSSNLLNLTATNNGGIDMQGGQISAVTSAALTSSGIGAITQSSNGLIKAPVLNLAADQGNIGMNGAPVNIDVAQLAVTTGGAVNLLGTGSPFGAIKVISGQAGVAQPFSLATKNSISIDIAGDISANAITLEAGGIGSITRTTGTGTLSAGTYKLVAGGNIGFESLAADQSIKIANGTLSSFSLGGTNVSSTGNVDINNSFAGFGYKLTTPGTVKVNPFQLLVAPVVAVTAAGLNNNGIIASGTVISILGPTSITLSGSGIMLTGGLLPLVEIAAPAVTLAQGVNQYISGALSITTSQLLLPSAAQLNASNSVFINNLADVRISSSGGAAALNIISPALTISGSNLYVDDQVSISNSGNVSLFSLGGLISLGADTKLASTAAQMSLSSLPSLIVQLTSGQTATLAAPAAGAINIAPILGSLNFTSSGATPGTLNISGGYLFARSQAGGNINIGANITSNAPVSFTAPGEGNILAVPFVDVATAAVVGSTVPYITAPATSLYSDTGTIKVQTATDYLSAVSAGGDVLITQRGAVFLAAAQASGTFLLGTWAPFGDASITTLAPLRAQNIQLQAISGNSQIQVLQPITATSSVSLTASGKGNVSSSVITSPSITATTQSGDIFLNVITGNLTASTTGRVTVFASLVDLNFTALTNMNGLSISNDQSVNVLSNLTLSPSGFFGNGGNVVIYSGGAISTLGITSNSSGIGTAAGMIALSGSKSVTTGSITVDGTNGGASGLMLISSPGTITTGNLSAQASGSLASGGLISIAGNTVSIQDVDVSSQFGSGGIFLLSAGSTSPFSIGIPFAANGAGNIKANGGISGGIVAVTTPSSLITVANGATVTANGGIGFGGVISFGSPGALNVQIDGLVQARNNADDSGMVQFITGLCYPLTLQGTGTIHGGSIVNASNLVADSISIAPTLQISNSLLATPCPSCFPPTPQKAAEITVIPQRSIQFFLPASLMAGVNLGLGERVPTDVENIQIENPPRIYGSVETYNTLPLGDGQALIRGLNSLTISQLQSQGLTVNAGTDGSLNLSQGMLLVAPDTNSTVIRTEYGVVTVKPGAIALVVAQNGSVAIYDIHDTRAGDVQLQVAGQSLALETGLVNVLTTDNSTDLDQVLTGKRIAFRQAKQIARNANVNVFSAEFSFVSAFAQVGVLRQLMTSSASSDRILAARLLKTASIRNMLRGSNGPFHQAKAAQP